MVSTPQKWISLEYSWIQHVFKQFDMIWTTWVVLKMVYLSGCVLIEWRNCWKNLFVLWRATQCQTKPRFKGLEPTTTLGNQLYPGYKPKSLGLYSRNLPISYSHAEKFYGKVLEHDHGNRVYHVGVYPKSHDIVGFAPHPSTVPLILTYLVDGPMFTIVLCFCLFLMWDKLIDPCVFALFLSDTYIYMYIYIYIYIYMHIRYHMFCWLNIVSIGRYHNFHIIPLL